VQRTEYVVCFNNEPNKKLLNLRLRNINAICKEKLTGWRKKETYWLPRVVMLYVFIFITIKCLAYKYGHCKKMTYNTN